MAAERADAAGEGARSRPQPCLLPGLLPATGPPCPAAAPGVGGGSLQPKARASWGGGPAVGSRQPGIGGGQHLTLSTALFNFQIFEVYPS